MSADTANTVEFHKLHGCGNDFVFIDNRSLKIDPETMPSWARAICPRATSVGADGLIFLEEAGDRQGVDYVWHFFNSDGSRAEMCGNASRCAARLALKLDLAGPNHVLGTDAGPIKAQVLDDNLVKVQLVPATDLSLNLPLSLTLAGQDVDQTVTVHSVNTGVPHAVTFWDDIQGVDLPLLGPALRYHEHFAPKGTNVNAVQVMSKEAISLRTYERGVEAETLACGTGAAAAALVAHELGLTGNRVDVTTTGGEVLTITLEQGDVFLTGGTVQVYTGQLNSLVLGLTA